MAEEEPPQITPIEEIRARDPLPFLRSITEERQLQERARPRFNPLQRSEQGFIPREKFVALESERGDVPSFPITRQDPDESTVETSLDIPSHEEVFRIPRLRGAPPSEEQLEGSTVLLEQALDLVASNRAPIFQSPDFNVNSVVSAIKNNVDEDGLTASPQQFAQQLADVIATGLADARSFGAMDAEGQVLNTVAAALVNLRESNFFGENRDPSNLVATTNAVFKELIGSEPEFPKPVITALRGVPEEKQREPSTFSSVRQAPPPIDFLVKNIYGGDLDVLAKRNPTNEELDRVKREQGRSFSIQGLTIEGLEELVGYLRDHVTNPGLRSSLIGDTNEQIRFLRGASRDPSQFQPRSVRLVRPLNAGETVTIERPLLGDIELGISDSVKGLRNQLFSGAQDAKKDTRRRARNEIDRLNLVFRRYNLKQRGSDKPLVLAKGNKSAEDLIRVIDEVARTVIGNRRNIFTLVPPDALGTQQDHNSILADIMRAVSTPLPSISRNMLPHPERISEFGEITIRREGNKREIIFGPGTKLESVMKLANAIVQEGGLLEGISGREMLEVKKGDDPGDVVSFFLVLLNNAAGEVVRLLYTPKGKGESVGGFLESMFLTPQLTPVGERFQMKDQLASVPFGDFTRFGPRRGGGIVSGVAGAVGNVANLVGTVSPVTKVITAPIKAVANVVKSIGSIFGF